MKRLYLLRHAKSAAGGPGVRDFDRGLAPRGRRAAPRIGQYMRTLGYKPEVALCSPARRTRQTWELVRGKLDGPVVEAFPAELYDAAPRALLECLQAVDDRYAGAILVGHNPGILTVALGLAGRGAAGGNPFGKYPAAALAVFDFEIDRWRDLAPGGGILIGFTRPKELDAFA